MRLATLARVVTGGARRARLKVLLAASGARRTAIWASAVRTGVLDVLAEGPRLLDDLADQLDVLDPDLLVGYLRVLTAAGIVRARAGQWRLTRTGHAFAADDTVRAVCEGTDGYHTALYRDLPAQFRDGTARTDLVTSGDLIARASRLVEPVIADELTKALSESEARTVLDLGCGTGGLLAHMLTVAPQARGIGIESDPGAFGLATRTLARPDLAGRVQLIPADATQALATGVIADGSVDLVLLANVIYYLPPGQRAGFVRSVAGLLAPGGRVVIVSAQADAGLTSTHFDLLLRAQQPPMSLPTRAELTDLVRVAGLSVHRLRRLTPGEPVVAVHGVRALPFTR